MPENTWVFDLEIVNAIQNKGELKQPGIRYCNGWNDHAGMGISVLVAARVDGSDARVFVTDDYLVPTECEAYHLSQFNELVKGDAFFVGHNSRSFDAKVLAAKGIYIPPSRHLDFYYEVGKVVGLFPKGYKLDDLSPRCGGARKSDSGALAPILWQQGERKRVIDYCKNDVVGMTCAVARFYAENAYTLPAPDGVTVVKLRSPGQIAFDR